MKCMTSFFLTALIPKIPPNRRLTKPLQLIPVLPRQLLDQGLVQRNRADVLGMMHDAHVLKAPKGHGEDQPLDIVLCIPAFREDACPLLRRQTAQYALFRFFSLCFDIQYITQMRKNPHFATKMKLIFSVGCILIRKRIDWVWSIV